MSTSRVHLGLVLGTVGLATMMAGMAGAVAPATARGQDHGPPTIEYAISDYTTGVAFAVVESTWDHHPQIERVPDLPQPRMIPIHRLPIPDGQRPEDRNFAPRPKAYAAFSGINDTGSYPPDPTIAVGPSNVIETVNSTIAFYNKSTGALQFSAQLGSSGSPGFFEGAGAGGNCFDPRVCYDDHAGRFVVMCTEVYTSTSWLDIAVSDDSDPNGTWYKYRTSATTTVGGNDYWVDYPSLGYDDVGYYVTGNLFGFSAGTAGAKYRIFDKTPMLTGGTISFSDLRDGGSFSVQPVEHHTVPNAPHFVSVASSTSIRVQAITNPLTSPSLVTTSVSVASFSSPPNAPNLGGSGIDTLDARIINGELREKKIVCGHGVEVGGNGRSVSRWYEIKTKSWPQTGNVQLQQSGNVDLGAGEFTYFPSLAYNGSGEIGMVMSFSSDNEYAGIAVAAQKTTDPVNTMPLVERVKLGNASYSNFRWGDYSDCVGDPSDVTKFWGGSEWARSTNSWGTWIFDFDSDPTVPTTGVLLSGRNDTSVGGFFFTNGDIVHLDPVSGLWSMYFDLSDVKTNGGANIDAFALQADGSLLISFVATENIIGMTGGPSGDVLDDEDIVRFIPTKLGENTAGSWVFYFDGSDVGLGDTQDEDTDALAIDALGNLYLSFQGPFDVGGGLTGKDEDVIVFTPTSVGSTTAGTWAMWFNGNDADVKLGSNGEDVDALDYDAATGNVWLSTTGDYRVPTSINGDKRDLLQFTATQFGDDTNGTFVLYLNGDNYGMDATADEDIDAVEILP